MEGDSHQNDRSFFNTPHHPEQSTSQTWNFDPVTPRASSSSSPSHRSETPRASRPSNTSIPRALFPSTPTSIFGSADPRPMQGQNGPTTPPPHQLPPPLALARSPPSSDTFLRTSSIPTLPGAVKSRDSWYEEDDVNLMHSQHLPKAEKDADDPTNPPSSPSRTTLDRYDSTTLTTLSRLFAVRAPESPEASRTPSYNNPSKACPPYARNMAGQTAALPDHLYARGLLEGRHSDITVHAFGKQYHLHRLILDRAHFFRSALTEPWLEANAKETTLHPEDLDPSITQNSFELALKRLYGCGNDYEEDQNAVGLFATACWLEMPDLVEASVESMLRQMVPETLSPLIKLVTSNYYGRAGDKVLASAKAMLCRDGWKMPLSCWDGIPADIIREIVGGDGFFIDGEWDRWVLAKKLLDRKLHKHALDAGLYETHKGRKTAMKAPDSAYLTTVRFDSAYRRNRAAGSRAVPDRLHRWVTLYTLPDVEPLLVLLDEGIHYLHLDFEQLQSIRNTRDALGIPVVPEKVISNGLWQQMELRQRIMNARDTDMELKLSVRCAEQVPITETNERTMDVPEPTSQQPSSKGKEKVQDVPEAVEDENSESGSWDGNGKPRKFWIPTSDANIIMGGNADPVIATSNNTTLQRRASRLSSTIQPEDVQWASDFAAVTSQPRHLPTSGDNTAPQTDGGARYTHFPPFRFAAEFPNPRLLKEKKRVYSRTVFYAGSLWNIYIQKVKSSRTTQLGVYLHRAKERETEEVIAGTAGLAQGSVDERIGQLERSMILGSEQRERFQRRTAVLSSDPLDGEGAESSGSAGDTENTLLESRSNARQEMMRGLGIRPRQRRNDAIHDDTTRQTTASAEGHFAADDSASHQTNSSSNPLTAAAADIFTPDSHTDESSSEEDETRRATNASRRAHIPTLPPYVDARPTIKTYFKIYSPSRGGRMLSVYESAPDKFNFSQSWGWKSSTLMLDEGLLGGGGAAAGGERSSDDMMDGRRVGGGGMQGKGDGKLRFMVVIGNI
ncbi:hypothetical protein BDY17DRAFT_298539 [Neohortaea acidophila]|uniref:BTB domain-containing protein n=1 Tax=Neohortaea acidophila TaxID=245834 RepID=A0A6A6PSG8_9PEZI|nr:uncharacterized protein BDY17DRAFT_298539 [Neohortaea acidophila]KAF2482443.1 hypothetical protein BDY17DRAFT_298539 [Neohortaea acidophila]